MKRLVVAGVLLAALAIAQGGLGLLGEEIDLTFSLAGIHPDAAIQPTEIGQRLSELEAWQGKMYMGYGDYDANTGPVSVTAFDPETSSFIREWVSDTEAIYNYRPLQGFLFAPTIDRRQRADYARSTPWRDYVVPAGTTHAFDMATLTGRDLWLVGSYGVNATAWRSRDGGRTWEIPLSVAPHRSFTRFLFAGVYKGKLYVQAVEYGAGPHSTSKVFDGNAWSDASSLLLAPDDQGWRPQAFAGKLVYATRSPVSDRPSRLMQFDGERALRALADPIKDFAVAGDVLVALTVGGRVRMTKDLESWQDVGAAPADTWSIALLKSFVYLGGKDGRLFRSDQALS